MNKLERRNKGIAKYKKRLKNYKLSGGNYALKTTGKPCSCAMCSPSKIQDKPKYREASKPVEIDIL